MGRQIESGRGTGFLSARCNSRLIPAAKQACCSQTSAVTACGGIDITQPIYFNLAPNYDALYRPIHRKRGLLHQAQGRWLSNTVGLWEVNGAWIGDDERYQNANPDIDADRWLFNTQHEGQFAQYANQNCVHPCQ